MADENEILEIKSSRKNYSSADQPFFMHDTQDVNYMSICNENELSTYFDKLNFNQEIKDFFSSFKTIDHEFYIKSWTIFSLKSILERYNNCYKIDKITIIDIGFKYQGMGHIKIIFYDPTLNKLFYRLDGGSNNYDRQDNYNKIKNYKSELNNNSGLSFEEFLQEANENKIETEIIF